MYKDYPPLRPNHSFTTYSGNFKHPLMFSHTTIPNNKSTTSHSKSKEKSIPRNNKIISYQELGQSSHREVNVTDSFVSRDSSLSRCKINPQKDQIEEVMGRIRAIEGKMAEHEHKIGGIERSNKTTSQLTTSLQ